MVGNTQPNGQLYTDVHVEDLMQDCSNSIANAHESLQSYTKPSI